MDSTWISNIIIQIGTPDLAYQGKRISDSPPGNNNQRIDPGETADLIVTLENLGLGNAYNVTGVLASTDSQLVVMDSLAGFGTIYHNSIEENRTNRFTLHANSLFVPGTPVTCSLRVFIEGHYITTFGFNIEIGEFRVNDPIPDGPRRPVRYWAYDDVDTMQAQSPVYDWKEIDTIGTRLHFTHNDQVKVVPIPAGFGYFKFYGRSYDTISVSVDGFVVCGADTTRDYSNTSLPNTSARPKIIAVNWDDLVETDSGKGGIWWYYDSLNHALVVEWDSTFYYPSSDSIRDKFEVMLYDSTCLTPTRDNAIVCQYLTAEDYTSSTVGIQDETRTIGIQCLFNGTYHPAAAYIAPQHAIKYTTVSPVYTAVNEDKIAVNIGANNNLVFNHPNPFKHNTFIKYNLGQTGRVKVKIYDVAGRTVKTLVDGRQNAGSYTIQWNGIDNNKRKVGQGIYFVRLKTDRSTQTRKIIKLD
jgi:hypothetical protein